MCPDVINSEKGYAEGSGKALGEVDSDKKGAQKSRPVGHCNRIKITVCKVSLHYCSLNHLAYPFGMEP